MNIRLAMLFLALAAPALAQPLPYAIVGTGQSGCFDDRGETRCPKPGEPFHGQDAQSGARAGQYRDNGDGTVTDLVTGLMWQRDFRRVGWFDAPSDAAQSRVGGHSDWRVPNIKELYSLINFDGATGHAPPWATGAPADAKPYLDSRFFAFEYPRQGRFIDAQYVSSTAYLGTTMGRDRAFFGVNFADGRIKAYPQDGGPGRRQWYARYVRGPQTYGRNDFAANGDGTVTDRATALVWMQADSGDAAFRAQVAGTRMGDGRLDWREALAFCDGLNFAGRSDWRLPHAKELHSIVDYSRAPDATHSPALDPVFAITPMADGNGQRDWPYFWSSTTHQDGTGFAVYFAFGRAQGNLPQGGPMMGGPNGGPPMGGPPPGGFMGPPPGNGPMGGPMMASGPTVLLDVHGAGAQRSSPKSGDESRLPIGAGPQGDVLRIYNYARCVAGGR